MISMDTPEWLKPGLIGAVTGAIVVTLVGFTWAGWMTTSSATQMARTTASDSVIAALVPVCVERSENDPDRAQKLATIQAARGVGRRDAVLAAGWATITGDVTASRALATACVAALDLPAA